MNKVYRRINWLNAPSATTQLGASNLNKMDSAIDSIDDRVVLMDYTKVDTTGIATVVKNIELNQTNGVITITRFDGSAYTIDTDLEKIAVNFSFDETTQKLIITLEDGTTKEVDLSAFIKPNEFTDTDTISFTVSGQNVSANIKDGSITEAKLQPNYLADCKAEVSNAKNHADNAEISASNADSDAKLAQSYAIGSGGAREGEATDNAKYYKELSKQYSDEAKQTDVATLTNRVDTLASGVECGGANIWDEQWETGFIDSSTGQIVDTLKDRIRSKNYCKIKPNTTYYGTVGMFVFYYDSNKNYINNFNYGENGNKFTTPSNAQYYKLRSYASYGTTYKNDIAIIEGTSGTYEPYIPYSVKTLCNKADDMEFLGWSVPSELGIQNYKDSDGNFHQRVGRVDLGSLDWSAYTNTTTGKTLMYEINAFSKLNPCICSRYAFDTSTISLNADYVDKTCCIANYKEIRIYDSSYTDATAFKSAMNGVYLYYELATEVVIKNGNEVVSELNNDLSSQGYGENAGGKNLLNPILKGTTTQNGITCVEKNGTYVLNGTSTAEAQFFLQRGYTIKKGTYKLTCVPANNFNVRAQCIDNSEAGFIGGSGNDTGNGTTITLSEDVSNTKIRFVIPSGVTLSNFIVKPMLTENLSATYSSFKPYIESNKMLTDDVATINESLTSKTVDASSYKTDKLTSCTASLLRSGNIVTLTASINFGALSSDDIIMNLPSDFKPTTPIRFLAFYSGSGTYKFHIDTNGKVKSYGTNTAKNYVVFTITYVV